MKFKKNRNGYPFLTILGLFLVFILPSKAQATTVIYRSVGPQATDALDTGNTDSNQLTISGSIATFSIAVPDNIGIGDVIQYDSDNDGDIDTNDSIVFIHGRTDSTHYTIKKADGSDPVEVSGDTDWSIFRAYISLANAEAGIENTGIDADLRNFDTWSGGKDISASTGSDEQWNIVCYANDTTADSMVVVNGWLTEENNYLRIFTPTEINEVGISQRHGGRWDTNKYRIDGNFNWTSAVKIQDPYIRLDGLQIRNTTTLGTAYTVMLDVAETNNDFYLSNSIIRSFSQRWNGFQIQTAGITHEIKIWNNIFSEANSGIFMNSGSLLYHLWAYNNSFFNNNLAVSAVSWVTPAVLTFKNNLFASNNNSFSTNARVANGSDYNATTNSTLGYSVIDGGNNNDRLSQTFSFVDEPNFDFHLTTNDTGAKDVGVNLSEDIFLSISSDIDGNSRPYDSNFDIGADEYDGTSLDVSPPTLSDGNPSENLIAGTTSTTIALFTNENAICKYSTTANTAYADMSNIFSTTGETNHSTTVSGLENGHVYHYYIRCQDEAGNANTEDYEIRFWVGSSGTVYAESCSQDDVQSAINVATSGDIVSVPAGECTWGDNGNFVLVNKAISLQGNGQDSTIINISSTAGSWTNGTIRITAAATVKGFTIRTVESGNSGTAFSALANNFRITDIKYVCRASTINGYFVYFSAYGLIDNNDITGNSGGSELIFGRGSSDSWQTDNSLGSKNNLFIEHNTFGGAGYVCDCNSNSRCVVRNNTITGAMKIDGHGLATNTPARGVRHMEIYNNIWTTVGGFWAAMELRGGTGMVFNNISSGGGLKLNEYCATGVWANCGGRILTVDDYPITDQIGVGMDPKVAASEPMYLWANTQSASPWEISLGWGNYEQLHEIIVINRDYYTDLTTDPGGNPVNPGIASGVFVSRPSTCTTGKGYWATDRGSWNSQGNDGVFYKCTSTDTWEEYYTPYAYPHGLTAESEMGTNKVDIGAGARVFGNAKFYSIGANSGNTAEISITPESGDLDNWLDIFISKWEKTDNYHKIWREESSNFGSINTIHVVGDLKANTYYDVKIDNILGKNITGSNCIEGVCLSNENGQITFTYSGGYSEHEFEVEEHEYDTFAPILSSGSPSGELNFNTVSTTLFVTTNENSNCKYATTANTAYADMPNIFSTTGETNHSTTISGLSNGISYTFYIRCQDRNNNTNTSDYEISFSVAATENADYQRDENDSSDVDNLDSKDINDNLNVYNINYEAGTNYITIKWKTDHNADSRVRYGTNKNLSKEKKKNENEKNHQLTLTGLNANTKYYFRVSSEDKYENKDSSKIYEVVTKKNIPLASSLSSYFFDKIPSYKNYEEVKIKVDKEDEKNENNDTIKSIDGNLENEQEKEKEIRDNNSLWDKISNYLITQIFRQKKEKYLPELKLRIVDKEDNAIPNLPITLHSDSQTNTTDKQGIAVFKDVSIGKHNLTFNYNGERFNKTLVLSDTIAKEEIITIKAKKDPMMIWKWITIVLPIFLTMLFLRIYLKRK